VEFTVAGRGRGREPELVALSLGGD